MYKLHFFIVPLQPLNKDEYLLINILRDIMQKKTYMKPLVSLYAIEASTIFAGSNNPQQAPVRPGFSFGKGDDEITSGDDDDVWE